MSCSGIFITALSIIFFAPIVFCLSMGLIAYMYRLIEEYKDFD